MDTVIGVNHTTPIDDMTIVEAGVIGITAGVMIAKVEEDTIESEIEMTDGKIDTVVVTMINIEMIDVGINEIIMAVVQTVDIGVVGRMLFHSADVGLTTMLLLHMSTANR